MQFNSSHLQILKSITHTHTHSDLEDVCTFGGRVDLFVVFYYFFLFFPSVSDFHVVCFLCEVCERLLSVTQHQVSCREKHKAQEGGRESDTQVLFIEQESDGQIVWGEKTLVKKSHHFLDPHCS